MKLIMLYVTYSSSLGKESSCNTGDLGSVPGGEDPLEKGMATHSSILTWRIPWTDHEVTESDTTEALTLSHFLRY